LYYKNFCFFIVTGSNVQWLRGADDRSMNEKRYTFIVNQDGMNIRSYLREIQGISRALLVACKHVRGILLNGKPTYLDHPVKIGDEIQLIVPEEESENIVPEPIPFAPVYEDDEILIVNKSPNMCIHPTMLHPTGTLANGVVYSWLERGEKRKFRPVTRLDKDTSGLVLIAKSQFAHQQLAILQQKGAIHRYYEALVHGVVAKDQGVICAPIMRKPDSIMERIVHEKGQHAVTHYTVLERFKDCTHVQLKLETGRTHQIRVHMKYINHPLLGDDLYGGKTDWISRQALHARKLSFIHPLTKEDLSFTTDLPDDMVRIIEKMRDNLYP
jgi:23S rRNA pseudouridine1911/1915/1917 synthase